MVVSEVPAAQAMGCEGPVAPSDMEKDYLSFSALPENQSRC